MAASGNSRDQFSVVECDAELEFVREMELEESHLIPNYGAYSGDVVLTGNMIVISPFNSHLILFYDLEGSLLYRVDSPGRGPGDFGSNSISLDYSAGKIYIGDENARYTVIPTDTYPDTLDFYNHISVNNFPQFLFSRIINVVDGHIYNTRFLGMTNDTDYLFLRFMTTSGRH
ncbi:MAG: hypothetical protein WDZ29_05045 [Balneolaceae bacterium]